MRRIFVDTSALIALRDAGDAHHAKAVGWLQKELARGELRLVLTPFVLAEVHAFFCRQPAAALAYVDRIQTDPAFELVRTLPSDEAEGWELLRKAPDKTYSFVDALSFVVMGRLGLEAALAFDVHFKQYGRFQVLP